jgi:hypothetical protein
MSVKNIRLAAAVGLMAALPMVVSGGRSGIASGGPASPEEREKKRQAKMDRAPKLLAKAEAKRARRAARNLSVASPSSSSETSGQTNDL